MAYSASSMAGPTAAKKVALMAYSAPRMAGPMAVNWAHKKAETGLQLA